MELLKLEHPVHTLEGQVLAEAGTVITEETLETLMGSGQKFHDGMRRLLEHGTVRMDLVALLGMPPYARIFPNQVMVEEVMHDMEAIELATPILRTMDYFRKNDFYTYRHILMVFALSTLLAKDLVPDYRERVKIDATGPTHDIGKICVPIEVLQKSSPLTRTELSLLHHHSVAGYLLLCFYLGDYQSLACQVALEHHERKNGSGYPMGIALGDPMVEIIAVCDVYDALIAPRPYRPVSYENRTALEELIAMVDRGELSGEPIKSLVTHNRKTSKIYCVNSFSHERRGTPPLNNIYGVIISDSSSEADRKGNKKPGAS